MAHSIPAGPAPMTSTSRSGWTPSRSVRDASPSGTPRRRSGSACTPGGTCRPVPCTGCCRCTRGCRRGALRRSSAGGRDPRSTAGRSDDVEGTGPHDVGHLVGRGEPGHAHDRLGRDGTGLPRPLELIALGEKARRPAVLGPLRDRAHVHVPEVDEVVGEGDEGEALLERDSGRPERIDGDAAGDRAALAYGRPDLLEGLQPETGPVLEGTPVSRRFAGCRTAKGTASAGSCARRTRRRCRSRPAPLASPPLPTLAARAGCRMPASPSAWRAGDPRRSGRGRGRQGATPGCARRRHRGAARRRPEHHGRGPRRT